MKKRKVNNSGSVIVAILAIMVILAGVAYYFNSYNLGLGPDENGGGEAKGGESGSDTSETGADEGDHSVEILPLLNIRGEEIPITETSALTMRFNNYDHLESSTAHNLWEYSLDRGASYKFLPGIERYINSDERRFVLNPADLIYLSPGVPAPIDIRVTSSNDPNTGINPGLTSTHSYETTVTSTPWVPPNYGYTACACQSISITSNANQLTRGGNIYFLNGVTNPPIPSSPNAPQGGTTTPALSLGAQPAPTGSVPSPLLITNMGRSVMSHGFIVDAKTKQVDVPAANSGEQCTTKQDVKQTITYTFRNGPTRVRHLISAYLPTESQPYQGNSLTNFMNPNDPAPPGSYPYSGNSYTSDDVISPPPSSGQQQTHITSSQDNEGNAHLLWTDSPLIGGVNDENIVGIKREAEILATVEGYGPDCTARLTIIQKMKKTTGGWVSDGTPGTGGTDGNSLTVSQGNSGPFVPTTIPAVYFNGGPVH